MDDFVSWLLHNLEKRDMSQAQLARQAGVTRAAISKIINGQPIGTKVADGIARAFNLPPVDVYRKAGILPEIKPHNLLEERAEYLFTQLPESDQRDILDYMDYKLSKHQDETKANS